MRNCNVFRISHFCAAGRIQPNWWNGPGNRDSPRSALRIAIPLPVSSALMQRRGTPPRKPGYSSGRRAHRHSAPWLYATGQGRPSGEAVRERLRQCGAGFFLHPLYPGDRAAWGRLCRLLSAGKMKTEKGECHLRFEDLKEALEGQMIIAVPPQGYGQMRRKLRNRTNKPTK